MAWGRVRHVEVTRVVGWDMARELGRTLPPLVGGLRRRTPVRSGAMRRSAFVATKSDAVVAGYGVDYAAYNRGAQLVSEWLNSPAVQLAFRRAATNAWILESERERSRRLRNRRYAVAFTSSRIRRRRGGVLNFAVKAIRRWYLGWY